MVKAMTAMALWAALGLAPLVGVAHAETLDDQFLAMLSSDGIDGDPAQLVAVGQDVCPWQDKSRKHLGVGMSKYQMARMRIEKNLQAQGLSSAQMADFVRDAIMVYCPEKLTR